jgi:hypothetical protein
LEEKKSCFNKTCDLEPRYTSLESRGPGRVTRRDGSRGSRATVPRAHGGTSLVRGWRLRGGPLELAVSVKLLRARNFIIPLLLAAVLVNGSGLLVLASHLSRSTGRATRLSPPLPEEKFDRLICSFFNRNLTVGRRDISRCSIRSESATPRAVGMVTSSSCSADRNVRTNRRTLTGSNSARRTCRVPRA